MRRFVYAVAGVLALSPLAAIAPASATVQHPAAAQTARASTPTMASSAIMRVMPDGTLAPLPSTNVIKPTATASTIKTFIITTGGLLSGIHACADMAPGPDSDNHYGVVCANLWAQPGPNGTITVSPAISAYCQVGLTTTDVTCAQIDVEMELGLGNSTVSGFTGSGCGHKFGSCPVNAKYNLVGQPTNVSGGCLGTKTQDEVWTVLLANMDIELPVSDMDTFLPANLASQHALVCLP